MRHLISALVLLAAVAAYAGSESHGGDTIIDGPSTAWFAVPGKTVRYCLSIAPPWEVTESQVRGVIQEAFRIWRSYLDAKVSPSLWPGTTTGLSLDFSEQGACDGKQDLTFYFGIENKEVTDAKAFYQDPVAFAHRTDSAPHGTWGKGFVWIGPSRSVSLEVVEARRARGKQDVFLSWSELPLLQLIVLHETGHVLGVDHVPGTAMAEDIVPRLLMNKLYPDSCRRNADFYTSIDDSVELVPCSRCAQQQTTQVWSGITDSSDFERLTGRKPTGEVSAHFQVRRVSLDAFPELRLADSAGANTIPISTTLSPEMDLREKVFQFLLTSSPAESFSLNRAVGRDGGSLIDSHGKKHGIEIRYNDGSSIISIDEVGGGQPPHPLFRAQNSGNACRFPTESNSSLFQGVPLPIGF